MAKNTTRNLLFVELETYRKNKDKLLLDHEGKIVLIKGKKILGVYHCWPDAFQSAVNIFGNVPFLLKEIERVEKVYNIFCTFAA